MTASNQTNTISLSNICLPIRDILAHRSTMFNYKLPSDRTMYESSLIYCNLCDYSCDLTDKSFIICHYLAKHPDDNIVYSYLWPQMEQQPTSGQLKIKYYLIKAHLKIRTKETQQANLTITELLDLSKVEFPNSLLDEQDKNISDQAENDFDSDCSFVMNKMIDWLDKTLSENIELNRQIKQQHQQQQQQSAAQQQEDVQELEEEQEVQEVEMFGEDTFDSYLNTEALTTSPAGSDLTQVDDLVKLASSASYYFNQKKIVSSYGTSNGASGASPSKENAAQPSTSNVISLPTLETSYLVHLLAINKQENVFRVKQIHDYYGGCFVCGKQVDFNMKHYQTHFNSEMTTYICLHCNYKEYRQENPVAAQQGGDKYAASSIASNELNNETNECGCTSHPEHTHSLDCLTLEEKQLQAHMTQCHSIDFNQILQQHQQLQQQQQQQSSSANGDVVVIESTPMNDMYLSITIKSLKFIDDDLLRKESEFKAEMTYSCPICTGDTNVYNAAHLNNNETNQASGNSSSSLYTNYENITFDYLMNHFLTQHQFKAIPLFVCTLCNCARVSLIDCVYHFIRNHFNKKITIGLCAYNIYDKIQTQLQQLNLASPAPSSSTNAAITLHGHPTSHLTGHSKKAAAAAAALANTSTTNLQLPLAATTCNTIYGSGPLVYCVTCNENYSNEASFIRHSFLSHLLDPNINLNWYKVYTPFNLNKSITAASTTNTSTSTTTSANNTEVSLQQIAAAMAMADLNTATAPTTGDANGVTNPASQDESSALALMYECPLCAKSVTSKDSINRHLLYHALNENFEYDITCSSCTKQLMPTSNLAECLLHTREFRSHRLSVNFYKYVLSSSNSEVASAPIPMVSCVLCNNESPNLIGCISHLMLDHFSYDSLTIKIKRFVSYMNSKLVNNTHDGLESSPSSKNKSLANKLAIKASKQDILDLENYFTSQFPPLTNEIIVSLITSAASSLATSSNNSSSYNSVLAANSASTSSTNRPDAFFKEIKCFKCQKFSTKLKSSLFQHLNQQHHYDIKDIEKLFESHIQQQLQVIDEQQLCEKFESKQKQVLTQQIKILKELKEKADQQLLKQQQQQKALIQQQHSELQSQQQQTMATDSNATTSSVASASQHANMLEQQVVTNQQPEIIHQPASAAQQQQQQHTSSAKLNATTKSSHNHNPQPPATPAQIDKIHSTIDQVLSQICKDDYDDSKNQQETMIVDQQFHQQQQQQQQITVTAQPPEAENLFVFKCNLCEPYTTDDATQLLEHYKIMHQVELTIADSSTLLAAAVAAFQTGHTIEMTGAILNTISSVTDENGLTIISGEEVPVHTTVQYKCTICQMIFYEKQYIVQHLYDMHNFEIDVSYFEEIEAQQQEQLQQKIFEQQQEQQQLMLQQQQLEQQQQQQQQVNENKVIIEQHQEQHHNLPTLIPVGTATTTGTHQSADETAAVMMMMMNGGTATTANAIAPQPTSGIILNASQVQQIIQQQQANGGQVDLSNLVAAAAAAGGQIITAQPLDGSTATASITITPSGIATITTTPVPETTIHGTHVNATPSVAAHTKPSINYSCTYCTFGTDKLKKMSDHLRIAHTLRDKTCMDNIRQQLIRLPNEDLPPYNQNPPTVHNLLQQQQQQQMLLAQQQQQQQQQQKASTTGQRAVVDNLSSPSINFTSNLTQGSINTDSKTVSQPQVTEIPTKTTARKPRNPRPKAGNQTKAQTLSKHLQAQHQANAKAPTILTMDANSQIIIDFNQTDDLLCSYCEYTMNNLNYMRTHIKYKHKNMAITFQNKITSRYYTIVEWPLTPVPTLTPAGSTSAPIPATAIAAAAAASAASAATAASSITTTPTSQLNQTSSQQALPVLANQQTSHQPQIPSANTGNSINNDTATTTNALTQNNQITNATTTPTAISSTANSSSNTITSSTASITASIEHVASSAPSLPQSVSSSTNSTPSKQVKTSSTKENQDTSLSSIRQKINNSSSSSSATAPSTPASTTTQVGGIGINTNNVNTILKKLGVNVSSGQSPLNTLISSIGSGTKTVNNSVVNVNLNMLKDVNIDEMIDDDDDEERKFLIKELEKKANSKNRLSSSNQSQTQQANGGYASDSGGSGTSSGHPGGIKRSRSNSSSNTTARIPLPSNALTPTSTNINQQQQLLSQLNITLNCHYCWAQFQLNVAKNPKTSAASIQQKENGKYMQHLSLHLNAPYKCNECSYPIIDTKTFFKHKQFYKHDEKTCIMVDNDISTVTSSQTTVSTPTRRKTLIAHRLRQHLQQQQQQQQSSTIDQPSSTVALTEETNEMQFVHDRDSFKCSLCYSEHDIAPCTSVSSLNKNPTSSSLGASNFSFDKEQVLKHVLIVHLSFLAYKCDTCLQFYAFDEPQTKQHAALVHNCGILGQQSAQNQAAVSSNSSDSNSAPSQPTSCHFKLIKTEEEINLAINRAQQFITKIPASSAAAVAAAAAALIKRQPDETLKTRNQTSNSSTSSTIEAQPKYKCCKCNAAPIITDSSTEIKPTVTAPIVLYSYQDALDHVMNAHMNTQSNLNKKDKKIGYELELFEQNLEDLIASETGIVTTISSSSTNTNSNLAAHIKSEEDEDDFNDENSLVENGPLADDYYYMLNLGRDDVDLSEWNVIFNEPSNLTSKSGSSSSSSSSPQIYSNRKKRFKTNNNTSITLPTSSSSDHELFPNFKKLRKFFFKPYLVYKCQLCNRKMNSFDVTHWLKHDAENHQKIYNNSLTNINYQQTTCQKAASNKSSQTPPAPNPNQTVSKSYGSFTEFYKSYKKESMFQINSEQTCKLVSCLICAAELKFTYIDILKHFQSEHEFNIFNLTGLTLDDMELIQTLQSNNQVQLTQGVWLRRSCYIKIPPQLVNPQATSDNQLTISKIDLIEKEINFLNEIYREQIVEKQIVSWLNSEQFLRRNFNYNSFVCIICNASKISILESHYNLKKTTNLSMTMNENHQANLANRLQFFSDEMKTVVLTNHILSHFNEYCYRCMSCKISWPDRTQLLKHAQECSNSQVVRTKTKYKLKANCRSQLKFYLQTYLDYWNFEKSRLVNSIDKLVPTTNDDKKLKCKVFLKDIVLNQNLLIDASSTSSLSRINLADNKLLVLEDEEKTETPMTTNDTVEFAEKTQELTKNDELKSNDVKENDVSMKEEQEGDVATTTSTATTTTTMMTTTTTTPTEVTSTTD